MAGRSSRAQRRAKILVVDDSVEARDVYAQYLRFCGYEVYLAADGQEAVGIALTNRPDVVVMDLHMPAVDGASAIRILKGSPRTTSLPIIVVTGAPLAQQAIAKQYGCEIVLAKPCPPDLLASAIERVLRRTFGGSRPES